MQKTVLVGVTGCVAIYKTCEIIRRLQKAGVRTKVVMTKSATHFIDPTLFRALTCEPVAVELFETSQSVPIPHISLSKEADVFLIAPCTANVIAKLAQGIADDLLTTTALATSAPLVIAPAMNVNMYENAATQNNMQVLRSRGVIFVDSAEGYLACGEVGKGRLAEPGVIVQSILNVLGLKQDLAGKRVLITAGPTVEPIDPVRFISNASSGKTGFAIAQAAQNRGAQVVVVSGPVSLEDPRGVKVVHVKTALEMLEVVDAYFSACDIAVFTAAISDFRPKNAVETKLKKGIHDAALKSIELVANPDILATMASKKRPDQVIVGFAAETENVENGARKKLDAKNTDFIVGNLVANSRAFGADENEVVIVSKKGTEYLPLMRKTELAQVLLDRCVQRIKKSL